MIEIAYSSHVAAEESGL